MNSISFYTSKLENEISGCELWAKDENMAYCENFSALIAERKSSKLTSVLTAIVSAIVK